MFNLKTASPEIKAIARLAGIKSGKWEPVNSGDSVDYLFDTNPYAIVARVSNRNKTIEITAAEIVSAHYLR